MQLSPLWQESNLQLCNSYEKLQLLEATLCVLLIHYVRQANCKAGIVQLFHIFTQLIQSVN